MSIARKRRLSENKRSPGPAKARPAGSWLDRLRARRRLALILTALVIAAIVAVVFWRVNSGTHESTDDAFIDARTVSVRAQVSVAIVDVPVNDNQPVEAGAVLVRLDDRDFRVQVDHGPGEVTAMH